MSIILYSAIPIQNIYKQLPFPSHTEPTVKIIQPSFLPYKAKLKSLI